jgi:hypothetical protein
MTVCYGMRVSVFGRLQLAYFYLNNTLQPHLRVSVHNSMDENLFAGFNQKTLQKNARMGLLCPKMAD